MGVAAALGVGRVGVAQSQVHSFHSAILLPHFPETLLEESLLRHRQFGTAFAMLPCLHRGLAATVLFDENHGFQASRDTTRRGQHVRLAVACIAMLRPGMAKMLQGLGGGGVGREAGGASPAASTQCKPMPQLDRWRACSSIAQVSCPSLICIIHHLLQKVQLQPCSACPRMVMLRPSLERLMQAQLCHFQLCCCGTTAVLLLVQSWAWYGQTRFHRSSCPLLLKREGNM